MRILDVEEISTFSIKVTEEIHSSNILTFLRTSLLQSDHTITKNTTFYYSYNQNRLTYEMIIFPTNLEKNYPEPFLYIDEMIKKYGDKTSYVCLTPKYFIFIENNHLELFKVIKNASIEDVRIYIAQLYDKENIEIIYFTNEQVQGLINENKKNVDDLKKYKIYPLHKENGYNYFLSFFTISAIILSFIIYFEYHYTLKNDVETQTITKTVKSKITHFQPLYKVGPLFVKMNKSDIITNKIYFKNNKIELTLFHPDKDNLVKFINSLPYEVIMKSLIFDAQKNIYGMEVRIEF